MSKKQTCPTCRGSGQVIWRNDLGQTKYITCPSCKGRGSK